MPWVREVWSIRACVGAWLLLGGAWFAHVSGRALPLGWSRGLAVVAIVATATWLAFGLWRRFKLERGPTVLGFGVLVVAFASCFAGLDHEIADRTWLDEGTYAHHASEINAGEWVRDSFVYPHALYYLGAFAIWLVSLAADPVLAVAREGLGIADWATVCRLVLRVVVAAIGASTVIPVAQLAARLAPAPLDRRVAGLTAGFALAVCGPWIEGSHLAICDVPSAAAAAWCLAACARWLQRPGAQVWTVAGLWSGLAAAAKYPAGLVALAIVAVAAADGWRRPRRGLLGLAVAGLASLAVFVATNPSLVVLPQMALYGDRGILFGAIQYAGEGWLGVVPESRWAYYSAIVARGFGWPILVAAALGLLLVPRSARRNALVLLAFPLAFAALLGTMTVAVERNVYPLLPPLAAAVGLGCASLLARTQRWPRAVLALLLLLLAPALWQTVQLGRGYTNPSTREEARAWMLTNLTPGLVVLREDYAPQLPPEAMATARLRGRFAAAMPIAALAERQVDVVILAAPAWARFFADGATLNPQDAALKAGYEAFFANLEPLARFEPTATRRGPRLDVYLVPVALRQPQPSARVAASGWFVPDGAMLVAGSVNFTAPGQWASVAVALSAGQFELQVEGAGLEGSELVVFDRGRRELARAQGDRVLLELAIPQVVVVSVHPAVGATVTQLSVGTVP